MSEIGLGRRASVDSRDRSYLIPDRTDEAASITHRTWWSPGAYDQGATSRCVAYAGVKFLTTWPIHNEYRDPGPIYHECLKVDEWPGEDEDGGTSVRALFKMFKGMGLVSEYRWAFDLEPVINHLLTTGPVVMGTAWTYDMFMPHNKTGYIFPTGDVAGGHAWLLIGANRTRRNPDATNGAVRMVNSWGTGWGDHGRAWMTFGDLAKLMGMDGEACVATEIKHA
jgi:C1A family cysteine protease